MAEYQLYCFAQSGNAYRAALMLNLIGADWEPIWVDFFGRAPQRTPDYRETINEMGEAPVLVHGTKKLSQSGVILTYLADHSGKFMPQGEDEGWRRCAGSSSTTRRSTAFSGRTGSSRTSPSRAGDPAVMAFLQGRASTRNLGDRQQAARADAQFLVGDRPTIADLSMAGYMYYPAEEFGFDIAKDHPAIAAWLERMQGAARLGAIPTI